MAVNRSPYSLPLPFSLCFPLSFHRFPHVGASSNLTFSITLHIGPRAFVTMAAPADSDDVGRRIWGGRGSGEEGIQGAALTLRILERHWQFISYIFYLIISYPVGAKKLIYAFTTLDRACFPFLKHSNSILFSKI